MLKSVLYHPVRARAVYDVVTSVGVLAGIWSLFTFFRTPVFHPSFIILLPAAMLVVNSLSGIYTSLKVVRLTIKVLVLLFNTLCVYLGFAFVSSFELSLSIAALAVYVLLTLPRVFLNFNSKNTPSPYLQTFRAVASSNYPVLVVGGAGYIGTYVVEQLLDKGYKVRVLDKFTYGNETLNDLKKNKNLEVIEGDLTDIFQLNVALQNVQAVIHLAGLVGDPACSVDPKLTHHINIVATRMLKEAVKAFQIPRFIFASSCSVYGTSDEKVDENSTLNPVSIYAQTKIDSEKELLSDQYDNFHPTILRFATVFGHSRRMRFDLVTNLFTAQAYNSGVITVIGSNQWRPFIHVSDVARSVVMAFEAPLEKVSRRVFNVGDDSLNVTIGELAKKVAKIVKQKGKKTPPKIEVKDNVQDRRNYNVAFNRIVSELGFHATMTLEAGIKEMYKNFENKTYKKPYTDLAYSNVEMTKFMKTEFESEEYKTKHFSPLAE